MNEKRRIMKEIDRLMRKAVEFETLGRNSKPIWETIFELRNELEKVFNEEGSSKKSYIEVGRDYTVHRVGRTVVANYVYNK